MEIRLCKPDITVKKIEYFIKYILSAVIVFIVTFMLMSHFGHADNLTDLCRTDAFRGSFKWISKMSWIGGPLQALISFFSFIGMVFVVLQTTITFSYLAGKNFWDTVAEVKKECGQDTNWENAFGLKSAFTNAIKGGGGSGISRHTGVDSILYLFYMAVPNLKELSDYSDRALSGVNNGLEESDNPTTYVLKIAPRKILIIFFLAMGFNGTLMLGFANIVDGMGRVAQTIVDYNMVSFVDRVMNIGSDFKFSFASGPNDYFGDLQSNIAHDLYSQSLSAGKDWTAGTKNTVGAKVQSWVTKNITPKTVNSYLQDKGGFKNTTFEGEDFRNVKASVVLSGPGGSGIAIPSSELGLPSSDKGSSTFYVQIHSSGKVDKKNYFDMSSAEKIRKSHESK